MYTHTHACPYVPVQLMWRVPRATYVAACWRHGGVLDTLDMSISGTLEYPQSPMGPTQADGF